MSERIVIDPITRIEGHLRVEAEIEGDVVFKKSVDSVKYMPIDILIKENIDFYFEFV